MNYLWRSELGREQKKIANPHEANTLFYISMEQQQSMKAYSSELLLYQIFAVHNNI